MARQTIGQKAQRMLRLLMGLRHPRAATSLAAYGFTQADMEEGWERLRALSGRRLAIRAPSVPDPTIIERLDAFENRWFPVAQASLQFRYPEVASWLFLNLTQTSGLEVVVSVGTFLERLRKMEDQPLPGAAEARALLAQRGLAGEELAEAEQLMAKLPAVREPEAPPGPSAEEQKAAEDAMWAWYLEWSQIARVAIHDRRLLRSLGFLRSSSRSSSAESEEDFEDDEDRIDEEPSATSGIRPGNAAPGAAQPAA